MLTRSQPLTRSLLLVRYDVINGLTNGRERLCIFVGYLDPELILELHDQLNEIEGVSVEVVLERSLLRESALLRTELLDENGLDALGYFFTG